MAIRSVFLLAIGTLAGSHLAAQVNFAHDIAPVIYTNCVPCHHAQGPGPFPLTSYDNIRKHASQIAEVTRSRYMPPWLPDEGHGDFAHELRLSEVQIQTISKWVTEVAKLSQENVQAPEWVSGWVFGKPDVVLTASQPFLVPAEGTDVYWNFVFAPHLKHSRYIRAIEIRPLNAKLIHHANIIVDRLGSITQPFAGMDVSVPRNPLDLDGHFLFFKPGGVSDPEPDGFSWRMDTNTTLILNTHIQTSGKAEMEQPTIALYFTDKPPAHSPYLLQLQNDNTLNIPAGTSDFLVSDDFKLPIDTEVLAIYPHAHYLGHLLEAYATLPNGTRKWLIRIPNWDPNWQSVFRYRTPVNLPAGTVISMRFHYDNSCANPRNPNRPPKRIESGDKATDEMAHLWLQVMAKNPQDSRRLYAEAWAKHEIEKDPSNYAANLTLGSLAMARLAALDAVKPLQIAVSVRPDDAIARNLYGSALESVGMNQQASQQFEDALKIKPNFTNARFNLAHAEAKAGRKEDAIQNLKLILKTAPDDPAAKSFLDQLTPH